MRKSDLSCSMTRRIRRIKESRENLPMRFFQGLTALAFVFCTNTLQASTSVTEQVKKVLADELYPVTSVLPDYQRPRKDAPRFAVAEFRTVSDDRRVWSQAVSEILRYRIQYVPAVRLFMPAPYYTHVDAQQDKGEDRPLLTSTDAFNKLNQTLGIDKVLTGQVGFSANKIALTAQLVKVESGKTLYQRDWSFPAEELPAVLIEICKWVYRELGVKLTPAEMAYLEDPETMEYDAIEAFIANYTTISRLQGPLRRDKIRQLQEAHPNFVLLAIYALHNRTYARNLDDAYSNLDLYENLRNLHAGNAGVALESFRVMEVKALPKHKVARQLDKLKRLAGANSQDPTIMINCGDALVKNGDTHEAVTVMLEAAERWPDQYRTWWSLGWALNEHAWQIRGSSTWRDVPARARDEFKALTLLSDKAVDNALTLNSAHGGLWGMKINSLGSRDGFTEELLETFDKAIKLAPQMQYVYSTAMNYATDRWGGNAVARAHILETAETHNPDASWVEVMKREHGGDSVTPSVGSLLDRLIDFLKNEF